MSDEKAPAPVPEPKVGFVERWVGGVIGYITGQIRRFVAFLFFVFTVGAALGVLIAFKMPQAAGLLVLVPAIMGLLAYYSTVFALIGFILFAVLLAIL